MLHPLFAEAAPSAVPDHLDTFAGKTPGRCRLLRQYRHLLAAHPLAKRIVPVAADVCARGCWWIARQGHLLFLFRPASQALHNRYLWHSHPQCLMGRFKQVIRPSKLFKDHFVSCLPMAHCVPVPCVLSTPGHFFRGSSTACFACLKCTDCRPVSLVSAACTNLLEEFQALVVCSKAPRYVSKLLPCKRGTFESWQEGSQKHSFEFCRTFLYAGIPPQVFASRF